MTDKLAGLQPDFLAKVNQLLANCQSKYNLTMRPIQGLRTIQDQAKLWRQGRSSAVIADKIHSLKVGGAPYLASVLDGVGPQAGNAIVTDALPGYGWHNWGYALDCYVIHNGEPIFSEDDPLMDTIGNAGYETYAEEAQSIGLRAGYYFTGDFQDRPHVQMFNYEVPSRYSISEINDRFASLGR